MTLLRSQLLGLLLSCETTELMPLPPIQHAPDITFFKCLVLECLDPAAFILDTLHTGLGEAAFAQIPRQQW